MFHPSNYIWINKMNSVLDHFEVCVIGAGLLGSATAKYLAARFTRVCLLGPGKPGNLDSEENIFEAWNDCSRIAHVLFLDRVWAQLAKESIQRYRQIEEESGVKFFSETGYLILSTSHSYIDANVAVARHFRMVDQLDVYKSKDELMNKFQFLQFPLNSNVEGVFERRGAGLINPIKFVEAQRVIFTRCGGIHLDEVAMQVQWDPANNQFSITTRSGRVIKAGKVVICAGAFLHHQKLLPDECRLDISFRPAIVARVRLDEGPALKSLMQIPPLIYIPGSDASKENTVCNSAIYTASPVLYPDGHYYLKIGYLDNTSRFEDRLLDKPSDVTAVYQSGSEFTEEKKKAEEHLGLIAKLIFKAGISDDVILDTCCWVNTPNGRPCLGQVAPGWFVATGDNGFAAKSSDEIGRLMADMVTTGQWTCSFPKEEDVRLNFRSSLADGIRKDGSAVCWETT